MIFPSPVYILVRFAIASKSPRLLIVFFSFTCFDAFKMFTMVFPQDQLIVDMLLVCFSFGFFYVSGAFFLAILIILYVLELLSTELVLVLKAMLCNCLLVMGYYLSSADPAFIGNQQLHNYLQKKFVPKSKHCLLDFIKSMWPFIVYLFT